MSEAGLQEGGDALLQGGGGTLLQMRNGLRACGLELVETLCLGWYNEAAPLHTVSGRPEALAIIVGSGSSLWQPFLAWQRERLASTSQREGLGDNPVDEYVMSNVDGVLRANGLYSIADVHWSHDLQPGRMVALQKAAQCNKDVDLMVRLGEEEYELEVRKQRKSKQGKW